MEDKKDYRVDGECTATNIIDELQCTGYVPCNEECCNGESSEDKYCVYSVYCNDVDHECGRPKESEQTNE